MARIIIKTRSEIEAMRRSGKAAAVVLQRIGEAVGPGATTYELDQVSHKTINIIHLIQQYKDCESVIPEP